MCHGSPAAGVPNTHRLASRSPDRSRPAIAVAGALLLLTTVVAHAESWMGMPEMKSVFGGKTIVGRYVNGDEFTETYWADGGINYKDKNGAAVGRWHVSEQGFCTFYENMNGGCFLVRKSGDNCFDFYVVEDQDTGPLPDGDQPSLVAQGWSTGKPSTCVALAV